MGEMLADRVAVVTGAGRGIGRGVALGLAAAGAKVVVNGRDTRRRRAVGGTRILPPLGAVVLAPG